ncbi:MAG: hypothetical protein J4452_01995 [Candidatus Aenigmarchaeota archaeon]|nr:hypothetical protein [Candidatus Aenigmarchaeota archaeon]
MLEERVLTKIKERISQEAYSLVKRQNSDGSFPYRNIPSNVDATVGSLEILRYYGGRKRKGQFPTAISKAKEYLARQLMTEEGRTNCWTKQKDDPQTIVEIGYALYDEKSVVSEVLGLLETRVLDGRPVLESSVMMQNEFLTETNILGFLSKSDNKLHPMFNGVQREVLTHQQPNGSFYTKARAPTLKYRAHQLIGGFRRELTASFILTFVDLIGHPTNWEYEGRRPIEDAGHYLFHPPVLSKFVKWLSDGIVYGRFHRPTLLAEVNAYLSLNPGAKALVFIDESKVVKSVLEKPASDDLYRLRETSHLISIKDKLEPTIN